MRLIIVFIFSLCLSAYAKTEKFKPNYDEALVGSFTLPDPLLMPNGEQAKTAFDWMNYVRPHTLDIFQRELYGYLPPRPKNIRFELLESSPDAIDGMASRKQIRIHLEDNGGKTYIDVLLYIPKGVEKPVPTFIYLNFYGNHSLFEDKEIIIPYRWVRKSKYPKLKVVDNKMDESHRGQRLSRMPIKMILSNGFAVATAHYGDIYPDDEYKDMSDQSIYQIFSKESGFSNGPETIAWAWGASRILDCLESLSEIDSKHVAIVGQSRLGRTALLTAALDERFALACGNNPGCMGAAISRRNYGETIASMVDRFKFWFSKNLRKYAHDFSTLPVDQHQLIACIAPRGVYVTSASEDNWGDPKGELMGLVEACKVYNLFGAMNTPTMENFEIEKPFIGDVGYHMRKGAHDLKEYDWEGYVKYFKKLLKK